ncbi:hypothetical protein HFN89_05335 [Rhizobium laguerreae]|nr:hypothetical protein [Rhizobium laguerreae]
MNIKWHENPLRTTVELTDNERERFRLKLKIDEYEEAVGMAALYLDEKGDQAKYFSPETARRYLARVQKEEFENEHYDDFISEIESGYHCGDCTSAPSSCAKCYAEGLLGIDTIPGLKHDVALYIDTAFGRDENVGIDEAIRRLKSYEPVPSGGWLELPPEKFAANVDHWKKQARAAHKWLVDYKRSRLA